MTDAGFFRGTSADQDNRFADKQKKYMKSLKVPPILNTKINIDNINLDPLKPWIEERIKVVLEKDDEILFDLVFNHLTDKNLDGKNLQLIITGFADEGKAFIFMEELWTKLIELENQNSNDGETAQKTQDKTSSADNNGRLNESSKEKSGSESPTLPIRRSCSRSGSSSRSRGLSRSVSQSPGRVRLNESSRGRPRKRALDEPTASGSKSPSNAERHSSASNSRSRSRSRSPAERMGAHESQNDRATKPRRSASRSVSRSRSYSRSRSVSRSPRNQRSPLSPRGSRSPIFRRRRFSRSRSRDRDLRYRSRSPRRHDIIRRPYRGGYYNPRRRGGPIRRRSPWSRHGPSPRSPRGFRRSPSMSPRRRRSPAYSPRRRSISPRRRSPMALLMDHPARALHQETVRNRPFPSRDMDRPFDRMGPRIPHVALVDDHRGFTQPMLARRSPDLSVSKPLLPMLPADQDRPSPSHSKRHKHEKKSKKHKDRSSGKDKKHKHKHKSKSKSSKKSKKSKKSKR